MKGTVGSTGGQLPNGLNCVQTRTTRANHESCSGYPPASKMLICQRFPRPCCNLTSLKTRPSEYMIVQVFGEDRDGIA